MLRALPSVLLSGCSSDRVEKLLSQLMWPKSRSTQTQRKTKLTCTIFTRGRIINCVVVEAVQVRQPVLVEVERPAAVIVLVECGGSSSWEKL